MKTAKNSVLLLLPLSTVAFVPSSLHGTTSSTSVTSRRFSINEDSSSSSNVDENESTSTAASNLTTESIHNAYFATAAVPTGRSEDVVEEEEQHEQKEVSMSSQALPFLPVSDVLRDSPLAGNAGFDPLHLASSKEQLMWFREAEIKHARLAMLAAAGWPVSEMLDRKLAAVFGFEPLLDAHDRAPSLFDNLKGLERVSPAFWGALFGLTAVIELEYGLLWPKSNRQNKVDGVDAYFPGKLDLDPLGFYPKTVKGQQRMQLAEIKHGRIAMVAVVVYMMLEYITKEGIVDEVQTFLPFFPILPSAETLEELEVPLMVERFGME